VRNEIAGRVAGGMRHCGRLQPALAFSSITAVAVSPVTAPSARGSGLIVLSTGGVWIAGARRPAIEKLRGL
jgi:hypothetical protein